MDTTVKAISDTKCRIVWKTSEFNSTKLVYTNSTVLQNTGWTLAMFKDARDILFCSLIANGRRSFLKAEVKTVCRLLKQDGSVDQTITKKLNINSMNFYGTVFWIRDISKISKDCLTDGNITLECDLEILEISGNYTEKIINFKESNSLSNATIIVGDETFYVNKQVLSCSSSVFEKMFNCEDDSEDIINLKDETPIYFLMYLHMLYNCDVHPSSISTPELLKYAQKFETPLVTQKYERYLIDCPLTHVPLKDKKIYAEKYGLKDLAKKCEKMEKEANQSTFSALVSYISNKLSYL